MSSSGITDLRSRLKGWLATRGAVGWIAALGVVLTASSLWGGLAADDFLHAVVLRNLPLPRPMSGPLDLFRFASGDPKNAHDLMNLGQFQWTVDPTTRFAFFRPLSAATHILDYALWPSAPWLMHAQNLAWFALAITVTGTVYRRFIGQTWVAGFALLLFAIDDSHGPTVGWIANRNSIIALSIGLPVLILHDRWRRERWVKGAWLGSALLAVALLAGESALAIVAYLAAYTLHIEKGSWRTRAGSLLPYSAVLLVWRATYSALGYGVSGSGLYLDPGQHPLEFLAALPRRLPFLLLADISGPRADLGSVYEFVGKSGLQWMLAYAVVVLGLLAAAGFRTLRARPAARFFATGMLLSALPVCAAFTSDRLLLFVSVGAMGLVAEVIAAAASFGERAAAAFLLLVHLVMAPPLLLFRARYNDFQFWIDVSNDTIPKTPEVTSKTVVIVNPPSELFSCYMPAVRAVRGEPMPGRLRGLAGVVESVDVTRLDDRTLSLRPRGGFLAREPERMLRSAVDGLPVGSNVTLDGMTVTVNAITPDGRPAEALFRFDTPLEDTSMLWFVWTRDGYARWVPPAIGETAHLPAHDIRRAVLDIEDRLSERR